MSAGENKIPSQDSNPQNNGQPVNRLMAAVIQIQDVRKATRALDKIGLSVIRLPTTGAFLGRRNITLLISYREGQEEAAVEAIHKSCHRRVEYVSTPLEGAPMPIPLSTPISVGGATIFTLEIEHYEEF